MVKTINVTTEIPDSREIRITLPDDVPTGPAELFVVITSPGSREAKTLSDLFDSEFFGMWRGREDMADSAELACQLREEAWNRTLDEELTGHTALVQELTGILPGEVDLTREDERSKL